MGTQTVELVTTVLTESNTTFALTNSTYLSVLHDLSSSEAPEINSTLAEVHFYPLVRQPVHMLVIYTLAYSIVFVSGIVGNSLVVSVVYKNTRMHTVTNYFIVNLAIADILVCIFCLPFSLLSNLFSGWRFGAVMCKVTPFLQGVAVSASVNTLAAIAFDRYLAICHSLEYKLSRRAARLLMVFIWVFAVVIMTPWPVYYRQIKSPILTQTIYICQQDWPSKNLEKGYFLGAIFLTCYTIPLVFITIFYSLISYRVWHRNAPGISDTCQVIYKSKVKVLKMMMIVVTFFALSWLPTYAVQVRVYFGPQLESSSDFNVVSQIIIPIAQWLGSSNSCMNPIIYCLFSNKFRKGFKELFFNCCNKTTSESYFGRSTVYRSTMYRNGGSGYTHSGSTNANSLRQIRAKCDTTYL